MSRPPSSFRADGASAPASASRWPWLLAAGPAIVVVASLATAWIAATRGDRVVDDNYYKVGLAINRRLAESPAPVDDARATLTITSEGRVRLHVDEASRLPARVSVSLRHPGQRGPALPLVADGERDWNGSLADLDAGRRIVTVESDAWNLPITVIDGLPTTIRLGTPASTRGPRQQPDPKR